MINRRRYLEMRTVGGSERRLLSSGIAQALLVLFCATAFNLPRWYEYEITYR